jgi:hypothetical protein
MSADRGGYSGEIPGRPAGCTIDFYLEATDIGGNVGSFPADAPASYRTFVITTPAFIDDAEEDQGWSFAWFGDDATDGIWVREDPVGTQVGAQPGQPEDDHTPDPGHICFVTANAEPGDPPGTADVDGGCTSLVSPTFDLTGDVSKAYLYYWRWFGQFGLAGDTFTVQVSCNNGGTWTTLEELGECENAWTQVFLQLDEFVPLTSSMRLRFTVCDIGFDSTIEGAVDDVSIEILPSVPTAAGDKDANLRTSLAPAKPNPAESATRIAFRLATPGKAQLDLFDAGGRLVRRLLEGNLSAGVHEVTWDGLDDQGRAVGAGVYFYRLRCDAYEQSSRVSLVR